MTLKSQARVERELALRWEKVQKGELDLNGAFGIFEDWLIQVGDRQAFLHPNLKKWYWYQRWNDEWTTAGCGPGEAILLGIGKSAGMKKLPEAGPVDDWCVFRIEGRLTRPFRIMELQGKLAAGELPTIGQVWSTLADRWLNVIESGLGEYSFVDDQGAVVLSIDSSGKFSQGSGTAKPSGKGKTA